MIGNFTSLHGINQCQNVTTCLSGTIQLLIDEHPKMAPFRELQHDTVFKLRCLHAVAYICRHISILIHCNKLLKVQHSNHYLKILYNVINTFYNYYNYDKTDVLSPPGTRLLNQIILEKHLLSFSCQGQGT